MWISFFWSFSVNECIFYCCNKSFIFISESNCSISYFLMFYLMVYVLVQFLSFFFNFYDSILNFYTHCFSKSFSPVNSDTFN